MVVIDRGRAPSVSVTVADDGSLTPSCGSIAIVASVSPRCAQTISFRPRWRKWSETPGPGKGPSRGSELGRLSRQTRPLGTVCQYVLLKTILPRCQMWFGLGGVGGCS